MKLPIKLQGPWNGSRAEEWLIWSIRYLEWGDLNCSKGLTLVELALKC
jgi:hypothetical protein